MTTDDRLRLSIHTKLSELLGPDEADAIMSNMLPVQWRDVATKDDLRVLSAELRTDMADLRTDVRTEIHDAIVGQTRWVTGYVTALGVVMLAVSRLLF